MKTLQNITLEQNGKPILEAETKEELNTIKLIKAVLNGCKYKNREDQRNADKIYIKLEALDKAENIELEDAEFELVKRYSLDYEPYLRGRSCAPFLALFDDK